MFFFLRKRGFCHTPLGQLTPVEIISRVTVLMSLDDQSFPAAPISFKFSSSHLSSFKCGGESSLSGRQRTGSPVNLFPSPLLLCSVFVLSSSPFKSSRLNSFSGSCFPPLPLSLTHRPLHNLSLIKVTPVPALSPEPSLVLALVDSGVTSPSGHDTQEGPPIPSNFKRAVAVTGWYVLTWNAQWNVSNHTEECFISANFSYVKERQTAVSN